MTALVGRDGEWKIIHIQSKSLDSNSTEKMEYTVEPRNNGGQGTNKPTRQTDGPTGVPNKNESKD